MGTPWDDLGSALAGRYRLLRELGRGGMAIVYLAEDERHDRRVAIKVLQPDVAAAMGSDRFTREIRIAAALHHPHILPVYDSGVAAGSLYYVMPLVEGESLRDRLDRERQLPLDDAIRIAREVAEALAAAHAHDVVHRDIKPENILLDNGRAMVADFGIARAVSASAAERLTQTGLSLGTPSYMSPEQASGERDIDGRSDLYSLGCVLYEMLIGEPPYTGPTAQAIIARRLTEPVPRLRTVRDAVSPAIEQVVVKSLARSPVDRFSTAAEMVQALARARDDEGSPLSLESTDGQVVARRAQPWLRSRAAAGVALVALLAAGAAWLRTRATGEGTEVSGAPNSVAVMYLESLSPDTLDAYLAYGLTEEITSRLTAISKLAVKSRSAVRRFGAGGSVDRSAAKRSLHVRYFVEGSVRRAGERVRVTVRLIRADDDRNLWNTDIEVSNRDLLVVQDSVARQVALAIGGRLTANEQAALARVPTANAAAYDRYLRGSFLLSKRSPVTVGEAMAQFDSALALDSGFAAARARLAYGYALFADWGWGHPQLTPEQVIARGREAADRALRQDSLSADAWLARAYLLVLAQPRTREGALDAFQRAIALDSTNAEAFYQVGQAQMSGGAYDAALASYARAIELDPAWASPMMSSGGIMVARRNLPEALRWLDKALTADSTSSYAYAVRSVIYFALGRLEEAARDAAASLKFATGYRVPAYAALAQVAAREGRASEAADWVGKALSDAGDGPLSSTDANFIAPALLELGRKDEALRLIERVRPRGAWLWFYAQKAAFDPIRRDPRFARVLDESRPPNAVDAR